MGMSFLMQCGFAAGPSPDAACVPLPAAAPPPPDDPALRKAIETLAAFVARNGPAFEALALRQNAGEAAFRFLSGGEGAEYYRWRVQVHAVLRREFEGPQGWAVALLSWHADRK